MSEENANPAEVANPIRLRVTHFLALVTSCALITSIRIAWIDLQSIPVEMHNYTRLSIGYGSILDGVGLTGLLCFAWHRWQTGRSAASLPGHWLLVFVGVSLLLSAICGLIVVAYTLSANSTSRDYDAWYLERSVICTLIGVNCLIFTRWISESWWWKLVLLVPGVAMLLLVPHSVIAMSGVWRSWFAASFGYAQIASSIAIMLLVGVASFSERDRMASYDWLHWTGVGVTLLFAIGGLIEAISWLSYYF